MMYPEKYIFKPKRIDDLKDKCLPFVGKEVTVLSWHSNYLKDKYPDDDLVGFVEEFLADVPKSELV
jgi:hypothetical protein